MTKAIGLTKRLIDQARADSKEIWLVDATPERGGGRLLVRVHHSGTKNFYFRYFVDGHAQLIPMGPYASDPTPGRLSLDQARALARKYSAIHRNPDTRDVRAFLHPDVMAPKQSATTLLELCNAYVRHLKAREKLETCRQYEGLLKRYLAQEPLAALPASSVTMEDVTDLLRTVIVLGLRRAPAMLRSLLYSSYALAIRARSDPTVPAELKAFGIQSNPVFGTASLTDMSVPRTRNLNGRELGHFWRELTEGPGHDTAPYRFVKLCMMLGGQRSVQLRRCLRSNVDLVGLTLLVYDPKGRRKTPRAHLLPLSTAAKTEIEWWLDISSSLRSEYLFPGSSEKKCMPDGPDSIAVHDICDRMMSQGLCASRFHHQDLRRTAETRMAEIGISKDIRAQIQSHGLGGVQARHYDMYDYVPEKRKALAQWQAYLQQCEEAATAAPRVGDL